MALTITNYQSYAPDYKFSFTDTEYDLSEFQNKLASRRNDNSLFLRRAGFQGLKKPNKFFGVGLESSSDSFSNFKMAFISAIESHDSEKIVSLYNGFSGIKFNYTYIMSSDDEIIDSIINAINSFTDFDFAAKSVLFELVISIFATASDEIKSTIVDGICITISFFLQNLLDEINEFDISQNPSENLNVLPFVLKLIQSFTSYSVYSQSAMISFGILDSIMSIASKNISDDITNQCLFAILSTLTKGLSKHTNLNFNASLLLPDSKVPSPEIGMKIRRIRGVRSSPSLNNNNGVNLSNESSNEDEFEVDIKNFENIIDPLFQLLHLKASDMNNIVPINLIINIFIELTNLLPILIKRFYENGIFQFALDSLQIPDLAKSSLNLIGNLPIYQSLSFIQDVLGKGLFEKLSLLVPNIDLTSDVFWVLSNFLGAAPELVIPLIKEDMVKKTVEIGSQSAFHVKREVAWFLSTLIIISNNTEIIRSLSNEQTIELIAEMLNGSFLNLTTRCIIVFQKIFDLAVQVNSGDLTVNNILQIFDNCDIMKQLEDIAQNGDHNDSTLIAVASKLLYDINGFTGSH